MPEFASDSNPYMGIARNLGEIFFEHPQQHRRQEQRRAELEAERQQREAMMAEQQKRSAAQAMLRQQRETARQQIPGAIQEAIAQQMPADLSPEERQRQQAAVNLTNQLIQAGMTPTPILRALNLAPVMPMPMSMNPHATRMAVPYGARGRGGGRNLRPEPAPMYGPELPTSPFLEMLKVGRR